MQTILRINRDTQLRMLAPLLGTNTRIAQGDDGTRWLQIEAGNDPQDQSRVETAVACVAGTRFQVLGSWLIRRGEQVAADQLPSELTWELLDDAIQIQLPTASLAAPRDQLRGQQLQLVRGGNPVQASALIARIADLLDWVDTTGDVRLRRLRWVCRGDEALVVGDPLPPIAGRHLVATDQIFVPAGFQWTPAVAAADVLAVFAIRTDQWLIWEADDHWNAIDEDAFISLRRSSVRRQQDLLDSRPTQEAS